jgi:ADP-ribose pyrophosphatase
MMLKLVEKLPNGFDGKRITVTQNRLQGDRGGFVCETAIVSNAIAVLPVLKVAGETYFILVKQYRFPVDMENKNGPIIEACAGKIDPGQTEFDAVNAELKQETGYIAGKITKVGEFFSSPGITNETIHSFIAEDLLPGSQELEPTEYIEVIKLQKSLALDYVMSNVIKDQKTCNLILQYMMRDIQNLCNVGVH